MFMKKISLLFSFLAVLLLLGCGTPAAPDPTPVVEAVAEQPTSTSASTHTAVPTEIGETPTATAVAEPATPTPLPAATTGITETAVVTTTAVVTATTPITPTGTLTATTEEDSEAADAEPTLAAPPPSSGVTHPPYEPSECGERYPCGDDRAGWEARIRVPDGFSVEYVARLDGQPTVLDVGPDGQLYIAAMNGTIYRMDAAGNVSVYATGFTVPTGLAFQPGTNRLYVSDRAVNRGIDGESRISYVQGGATTTIIRGLPCCYTGYHAANGIAFGPDGFGYVGVGSRADHGEILEGPNAGEQDMDLHPYEATILRFSPDGGQVDVYARGFRNPYSLAWDANGTLYTADNSPDYNPPEEFHRVVPGGEHGYPWYDCAVCFSPPPGVTVIPPTYTFIPNSAPTGVTAYLANQFPGYYNSIFVALWSAFPGAQKIVRMAPGGSSGSNFATGFAAPIDMAVAPDGSLYVADWATHIIFRISYTGS
jgi:glucose/arabinose dehydrogenase